MSFQKFEAIFYKNEQIIYQEEYQNLEENTNKIKFNMLNYNTTFDLEKETFSRENEEFFFFLDIKNKSCTIQLKKEELTFDIVVDHCDLLVLSHKIVLEYIIESDDAKNKIVILNKELSHE